MLKSFFTDMSAWSNIFLPQGKKESLFIKNNKLSIKLLKFSASEADAFFKDSFNHDDMLDCNTHSDSAYEYLPYNIYNDDDPFEKD